MHHRPRPRDAHDGGANQSRSTDVSLATVQALIARHIPLYRTHAPTYQTVLLQAFLALWDPAHARVLDIGGGTESSRRP